MIRFVGHSEAARGLNSFGAGVEFAWRGGAFAALFSAVDRTDPLWQNVDTRLALIAALGAFCFIPRLDVAAIAIGLTAVLSLVARDPLAGQLSSDTIVLYYAAALVGCAGVLRLMRSQRPASGGDDRDVGVLALGWVLACFLLMLTLPLVWPDYPREPGMRLFRGESALFILAASASVLAVMGALTLIVRKRRASSSIHDLESHAATGAVVSAVVGAYVGSILVWGWLGTERTADYQAFTLLACAVVGLGLWLLFYVFCGDNQHMRTWGALRASAALVPTIGVLWLLAHPSGTDVSSFALSFVLSAGVAFAAWRWIVLAPWVPKRRPIALAYSDAVLAESVLAASEAAMRAEPATDELIPRLVREGRADQRRIKAIFAAASGDDFAAVVPEQLPEWRSRDVPELQRLRAFAQAGRWGRFGPALEELGKARSQLGRICVELELALALADADSEKPEGAATGPEPLE